MTLSRLILLLCVIMFFGKNANAQDCPLPQASKVLQGNNISANILNGGDLFWDREDSYFHAPNYYFRITNLSNTVATQSVTLLSVGLKEVKTKLD